MKIAWSIGHYPAAKGVFSNTLKESEFDIAKEVVALGCAMLAAYGIKTFTPPPDVLDKKIKAINDWEADFAIESHFNGSSNPKASGCETLYFSIPIVGGHRFSAEGKKLAECIQESTLFQLRNASIKDRGAKGMANILRVYNGVETVPRYAFLTKTKMPAVICEPFFLTSPEDCFGLMKDREKEIERLARGVVDGILLYKPV